MNILAALFIAISALAAAAVGDKPLDAATAVRTVGAALACPLVVTLGVTLVRESSIEYLGAYFTAARYYEAWNELVERRITRTVTTPDGKTETKTETVQEVVYHPPHWDADTNIGRTIAINEGFYRWLVGIWGFESFHDLHRRYHTIDGDMYWTRWNGVRESLAPATFRHWYHNRVRASSSIFRLRGYRRKEARRLGLFAYPPVEGFSQVCLLGLTGAGTREAERELQVLNALLGAELQVRVFVLIYRGRGPEVSFQQEREWGRGHKNELVVTLGVDEQGVVTWCRVFSWSQCEYLKAEIRDYLVAHSTATGKPVDLPEFVRWLEKPLRVGYRRTPFTSLGYISREQPAWLGPLSNTVAAVVSGSVSGLL